MVMAFTAIGNAQTNEPAAEADISVKNKEQFDGLWADRQALVSHIQPDEWTRIIDGAQTEISKKKK